MKNYRVKTTFFTAQGVAYRMGETINPTEYNTLTDAEKSCCHPGGDDEDGDRGHSDGDLLKPTHGEMLQARF